MTTTTPAQNKPITFPRQIHGNGRAALERFGVQFSDAETWSQLFIYVTLPLGWREVSSGGYAIVDEKGRYRVSISQKFAIYESYANATVLTRLSIKNDANYESRFEGTRIIVTDGDEIFFRSEPILGSDRFTAEFRAAEDLALAAARAWCEEYRPEWRHPAAYWD